MDKLTKAAARRLRELEAAGADLDDIVGGEAGREWIEEDCGGDLGLAREAFQEVHPGARFFDEMP